MTPETLEQIHRLRDEITDLGAAGADAAADRLMAVLCEILEAQNACWIGSARLDNRVYGNPVKGRRAHVMRFLHPTKPLDEAAMAQPKNLECGYRDIGFDDVAFVTFPVNEGAESWFGIFRAPGKPAFTAAERDLLAYALRGIKWFHRSLMLSHGLLGAGAPLSPAERRVLHFLLTGMGEKQIAAQLFLAVSTTHQYVTSLFRKFNVRSRASLMGLWLGHAG